MGLTCCACVGALQKCRRKFSARQLMDTGRTDGDLMEKVFAETRPCGRIVKYMTLARLQDFLQKKARPCPQLTGCLPPRLLPHLRCTVPAARRSNSSTTSARVPW